MFYKRGDAIKLLILCYEVNEGLPVLQVFSAKQGQKFLIIKKGFDTNLFFACRMDGD